MRGQKGKSEDGSLFGGAGINSARLIRLSLLHECFEGLLKTSWFH